MERALELYKKTEGAFDIAIYPVMQAVGFPTQDYHVPDDDTLKDEAGTCRCIQSELRQRYKKNFFDQDGMEIDLGGIAKGYTSSQIMQIYQDCGCDERSGKPRWKCNRRLDVRPTAAKWRVAIQSPDDTEEYLGILEIEDQAVITSGGYERYFEKDGGNLSSHH